MNDILKNTKACSFRGVSFPVDRITTTGGATMSEYLLANSDRRIMKYSGKFPPEFAVAGIINSTTMDWQEFIDKANALRSVLEVGLSGIFTHPFYGDFFCSNGKYTLNDDFSKVGRLDFSVVFKQVSGGRNPLTPTGQLFSKPQVKKLCRDANKKLQDASAAAMQHKNQANKNNTKSFLGKISEKTSGKFASIGENIQKATDFTEQAFAAKDKAAFFIDNPALLFASVADTLLGIDGLTADVFLKLKKIQDLFEFGDSADTDMDAGAPQRVPEIPTTRDEAERATNLKITKNFIQCGSLIEYASYTADMTPRTVEDADLAIETMSDNYVRIRAILDADSSNESEVYETKPDYSDTIQALEIAMVAADSLIRQKRETAPYIRTISVENIPAESLSYLLYRDSTRASEIMALNGLTDPLVVSGEISVFSK